MPQIPFSASCFLFSNVVNFTNHSRYFREKIKLNTGIEVKQLTAIFLLIHYQRILKNHLMEESSMRNSLCHL